MQVLPQDIARTRESLKQSVGDSRMLQALPNEFTHQMIIDNYLKAVGKDASTDTFTYFNSHGLRSDELEGLYETRLLFAGCSITYGEGVPFEYTWPYMVKEYIGNNGKGIPYNNIATPGATITDIVYQIFMYMGEVGIPDTIFVNFPDYGREREVLSKSIDKEHDAYYGENQTFLIQDRAIASLIGVCNALTIDLYVGSWADNKFDQQFDYSLKDSLENKNFVNLKYEDIDMQKNIEFLDNYVSNMPSEYQCMLEVAIDEKHPGILDHKRYAKAFIHAFIDKRRTF